MEEEVNVTRTNSEEKITDTNGKTHPQLHNFLIANFCTCYFNL